MSEKQESKPRSKIIAGLMRIIEELENRIEDVEHQIREADLGGVLSTVNEFREIMNDMYALVGRDMDYFKIRVSVWESRDGLKASAVVLGHALEFSVDNIDPSTPVSKIIDIVLSNEENIMYAASRAFATLSDFAYKIGKIGEVRERLDNLVKEVNWLKKTLSELESVCEEE
jgi:archaellum component FlaC